MKGDAREEVLARIRKSVEASLPGVGVGPSVQSGMARDRDRPEPPLAPSPGEYRRTGSRSPEEILSLFSERVSEYRGTVARVRASDLPTAVARALVASGIRRLVVPADLPPAWIADVPAGSLEVSRDGEGGKLLSKARLASCHGVLTGCAMAIAATGTIVLDAGHAQGRRALTLLPDYHLCVVFGEQVVESVPEAVARLGSGVAAHGRPLTLVSGPSATSDIELIRVEGVHGPRDLEVILVEATP